MIKQSQETNWKQKFENPQNENICLTNLNVANNGNFPILAFGDCNENGKKSHRIEVINVCLLVKGWEQTEQKVGALHAILLNFPRNNNVVCNFPLIILVTFIKF